MPENSNLTTEKKQPLLSRLISFLKKTSYRLFLFGRRVLNTFYHFLFRFLFRSIYFIYYPLDKNLGSTLKGTLPAETIKKIRGDINDIRFKNIESTLFANAGAVFALVLTYVSLIIAYDVTVLDTFQTKESFLNEIQFKSDSVNVTGNLILPQNNTTAQKNDTSKNTFFNTPIFKGSLELRDIKKEYQNENLNFGTLFLRVLFQFFLLPLIICLGTIPIFLRTIVLQLSPEDYVKTTLSQLNKSQILTLLAFQNWTLIDKFFTNLQEPDNYKVTPNDIANAFKSFIESSKIDTLKIGDDVLQPLAHGLSKIENIIYKDLQRCIILIRQSSDKLGIHKREIANHILKFSPAIFERSINQQVQSFYNDVNINGMWIKASADSKQTRQKTTANEENNVIQSVKDFEYLLRDLKTKRKMFLEELMFFPELHTHLLPMASHTSTSLSLKAFIRGLSLCENETISNNNISEEHRRVIIEKKRFAMLTRSKSHCGVDLMVPLENYILKCSPIANDRTIEIKKLFEGEKKGNPKKDLSKSEKFFNNLFDDFLAYEKSAHEKIQKNFKLRINEYLKQEVSHPSQEETNEISSYIKNIQSFIGTNKPKKISDKIHNNYINALTDQINNDESKKTGITYIITFGFSKVLFNCLKENKDILIENNIMIFVFQDNNVKSLDTRYFRYELSKSQHENSFLNHFTAKDNMLKNLIKPQDKLVFMAGIEIYDIKDKLLFHTNDYQNRVENVIELFLNNKPEIWLLGEKYKVYDSFPTHAEKRFYLEFFRDHYNTLDLYKLKNFSKISLITEDGIHNSEQ